MDSLAVWPGPPHTCPFLCCTLAVLPYLLYAVALAVRGIPILPPSSPPLTLLTGKVELGKLQRGTPLIVPWCLPLTVGAPLGAGEVEVAQMNRSPWTLSSQELWARREYTWGKA